MAKMIDHKGRVGALLLGMVLVSVGVDQATGGRFPVPALVGDVAKVVIPALFVADGLGEAARIMTGRTGPGAPTTPTPSTAQGTSEAARREGDPE